MITSQTGLISVTGGDVWYNIVGMQHKNAVPLIALHGGPGYPSDYIRPIEGLADSRPVVFYDQLGCGQSDRPDDPKLWTIERFVEELAKVRADLCLDKVHIWGHSWGTMLAVDYMLTNPAGVESLVLSSPCLNISRWLKDADNNRLKLPERIQEIFRKHESNGTTDSSEYKEAEQAYLENFVCRLKPYPEALKRADAGCGRNVYKYMWGPTESFMKGGTLINYDRSSRLKDINVPTLFTCGRYDEASPDTVNYYHSLVSGSTLKIFENSAHCPHLEEPAYFLETVRHFLKYIESANCQHLPT